MEEETVQRGNGSYSTNQTFVDGSSLQIRLDPTPLINTLRVHLSGQIERIDPETNQSYYEQVGSPLCTPDGVRQIIQYVNLMCNAQVSQGNIDREIYGDILMNSRKDLAKFLIGKRNEIELKAADREYLIGIIMNFMQAQLSGVIDGFRTTSLTPTIKTIESNTVQERGGYSFLGSRRRGL